MKKLVITTSMIALLGSAAALAQAPTPVPSEPSTTEEKVMPPASPSLPSNDSAAPGDSAASATTMPGEGAKLTDAEAKEWIDKSIFSNDGKNVGEVAAISRDSEGKVTELHADVGGFLGLGETRARVMPTDFEFAGDHVKLSISSSQVDSLPKLQK